MIHKYDFLIIGAGIAGMSYADLAEAEEVFAIPDGRYLIVEA